MQDGVVDPQEKLVQTHVVEVILERVPQRKARTDARCASGILRGLLQELLKYKFYNCTRTYKT